MSIYIIILISGLLLFILFFIIKTLKNLERERERVERERQQEQNYRNNNFVRILNNNFIVENNNINEAIQNSKKSFTNEINEKINKIQKIKINKYIQENKDNCCITIDNQNNYNCCICYEIIDNEEDIYIIPCNHALHKKCLTDIAFSNPLCPFCRENLFI